MSDNKVTKNQEETQGKNQGVEYAVKGVLSVFNEKDGKGELTQTQHDCKIIASREFGTVSISMKGETGLMMTVRLDEMIEVIAAALTSSEEGGESAKEEPSNG